MQLHIIQHESFEAPGAIANWAAKNNHGMTCTRLYQGDTLPARCDYDCLIVMGGPQSPATTMQECPYFDARQEIRCIQTAIAQNKILLGEAHQHLPYIHNAQQLRAYDYRAMNQLLFRFLDYVVTGPACSS